jgi:hypothetical protein
VSVRVDSPGDDGTVEQVNAAVAEPAAQYQPEPTQYHEPIPAPDAQQAAPTAQPAASESAAEADGSTWTWEWDCGDAAPNIAVPADVGVENWTWNWNWNCGEPDSATANSAGEKPPQYQPAVTQYRPININISIRINSPGNNGPVLQTNVAVAVTPPALPQFRVESVNRSVNQPQTASAAAEASTPLGALIAVFDELLVDDPEAVPAEDGCCPLREAHGPATAAPEPESMLLPEAPPEAERDLTPQGRFRASVAVTMRLARASEALARSARPAPKPAQLRPAPHTSAPAHERAAALSAAGLAPLNAPDSRFGQIVFLVAAFAFAIAFADASRPVAAEVRARGEDPDPPPTRPG